jgi:hypothetical protein
MDDVLKFIVSEKTNKIYYDPIILSDGTLCEKDKYIEECVKTKVRPLHYYDVIPLKSFITNALDTFPELKEYQFNPLNIENNDATFNADKIIRLIENHKYKDLMRFVNYDLVAFINSKEQIKSIFANASLEVIDHFINNIPDVNVESSDNWHLINYVVLSSSWTSTNERAIHIIKKLLDKGADINSICGGDGWTLIHQMCYRLNDCDEFIIWMLNKNPELLRPNNDGELAISYALRKCSFEICMLVLTKIDKHDNIFVSNVERMINEIANNGKLSSDEKEAVTSCLFDD